MSRHRSSVSSSFRCSSCGEHRDDEAFYESQRFNGGHCKVCYRNKYLAKTTHLAHLDGLRRTCTGCGCEYVGKQRRPSEFCSRECRWRHKNRLAREAREASKPRRWCLWCDTEMPRSMRADAAYCSSACNSASHAKFGPDIRERIAERDAWICGICHDPIDPTRRWPDVWSLSIDHVIPRCAGGTNDYDNLQAAHLTCNSRKAGRTVTPKEAT